MPERPLLKRECRIHRHPELLFFLTLFFVSCQNGMKDCAPVKIKTEKGVTQTMGSKSVLFAHQSVGRNILEGVQRLGVGIPIVEVVDVAILADTVAPGIWHARLGKNGDPYGKITAFRSMLAAGNAGKKFDIALMKLCYVDIKPTTDINALFSVYSQEIINIKKTFPFLTIIHCTIPLKTSMPAGIKERLLQMFTGDQANICRNKFNELMRLQYAEKEPIFDLAATESSKPDGQRETFSFKGKTCEALYPGYTTDGGHLNEAGQDRAATEFLRTIAQAGEKK
ncbi:MAG: hypothetical protein JW768_12625 [Chitinispirillaceae bacterium]|nr:hypothetical protein [Chitinispirillaceae bacterium]